MVTGKNTPRMGSGGPAGTADQVERVRRVLLPKERRATELASMMVGYNFKYQGLLKFNVLRGPFFGITRHGGAKADVWRRFYPIID